MREALLSVGSPSRGGVAAGVTGQERGQGADIVIISHLDRVPGSVKVLQPYFSILTTRGAVCCHQSPGKWHFASSYAASECDRGKKEGRNRTLAAQVLGQIWEFEMSTHSILVTTM